VGEELRGDGWAVATFRVRYAETDAAGIVHHAAYLVWFEEGRSALSRLLGLPYAELEREGIDLVLSRVEARYRRPARYDDLIEVWTRAEEVRSRMMRFAYRVVRTADGEILAEGVTEHIPVQRASGRPVRLPPRFVTAWSEGTSLP
jgi:acyl-CoA thioester hydrolase